MRYKNQPWFSHLGLKEEQFASLPEGKNPLFWALENQIIDGEAFAQWSSEFFQKPRIQNQFFHMALDQNLPEKHKDLYNWSAHCYPIYEWESILYVACLEPTQIECEKNICYVIGHFDAMKEAWKTPEAHQPTQAPVATPPPVPDLDFSDLGLGDSDAPMASTPEVAPPAPPQDVKPKTPNQTPEVLNDLSFGDLAPSEESNETFSTPPAPPIAVDAFDDDETPPPAQWPNLPNEITAQATVEPEEPLETTETEVTQTDNSIPIFIPKEKRITDEDLQKFTNIDNCHGTKEILSHIIHHLKKDFQKMMWIELSESGQFFPRFVYGQWPMDQSAWNHPVDVSKPNIFRIAFKSSLPFHGEVSENSVNESYFKRWNGGHTPNQVTAFPLLFDEACYGFIVGFDKGPSFDEVDSLKKLENLISISDRAFRKVQSKKAS